MRLVFPASLHSLSSLYVGSKDTLPTTEKKFQIPSSSEDLYAGEKQKLSFKLKLAANVGLLRASPVRRKDGLVSRCSSDVEK